MREKTMTISDIPLKKGEWLKVNAGQTEFVRVLYEDADMFDAACHALKTKEMSNNDRIGILSDVFALSRAGYAKATDALKVALSLDEEDDPSVIDELGSQIGSIQILFASCDDLREVGNKLTLRVFKKMGERFGWEAKPGESELVNFGRAMALQRLALAGDEECVKKAMDLYKKDVEGVAPLSKDLRSLVHKVIMRYGTDEQIDALIERYRTSEVVDEKLSIVTALGFVASKERAAKFIEWAATSGELKTQDLYYMTSTMSTFHFDLMWGFIQQNWDFIFNTFSESGFILGYLLGSVVKGPNDYAMVEEFRKFFADKDISSVSKSLEHNYANVYVKSRWLKQCREEDIVSWINKNC